MADTQRALVDLLTNLFQDSQSAGSITANDIRDLITSLLIPYGGFGMLANAVETVIETVGVPVKVVGTTTVTNKSGDITISNNRMTYTGATTRHFHIAANMSFIAAGNNKIINFQWAKGGTVFDYPVKRKIGTGTDVGAVSVHADVMLSNGEYIELFTTNETDDVNLTVQSMYMFALGMLV